MLCLEARAFDILDRLKGGMLSFEGMETRDYTEECVERKEAAKKDTRRGADRRDMSRSGICVEKGAMEMTYGTKVCRGSRFLKGQEVGADRIGSVHRFVWRKSREMGIIDDQV